MVHLDGIIGNEISLDTIAAITNNGDRELSLTTVGGSLLYGKGMYDYATANNSFDTIHCFGIVASAGTIFLLAAKNRIASPNAKFLIHPPTGSVSGDAREMQKTATLLSDEENWLVSFYVEKLGKDEAFIKNLMLQNKVLNASEALELGLITEILNFETMENVTKKDLETFENSFFQKIKNFFNPKNMVVQSTDGTELEFEQSVETTEQIAVGQTLKAGGSPATGTYVLVDGTEVTADNGVITEVKPKAADEPDEMEALKTENETLKTQIAELQNKIQVTEVNASKMFTELQNDFTAFKNKFSNEVIPANTPPKPVEQGVKGKFSFTKKN